VEPLIRSARLRLPPDLEGLAGPALRDAWPQWIERHVAATKARLQRGEEDTLANFVLFGVSFTALPRLTAEIADPDEFDQRMRARIQNFVDALAAPGANERLQQLGALVTKLGYSTAAGEPRERLSEYVLQNVERYLIERQRYETSAAKTQTNDTVPVSATAEFYKNRGLSVDTDFRPNFAIEIALAEVRRRGLLKTVRRVAILGPGLDFTDKDSGFDHYPLQTLQPFAVVDSLLKLGMARANDLRVSLFDLSPAVLDHVARAVARSRSRQPYTIQLVLDRTRPWSREVLDYWQRFGSQVGANAQALALPAQLRQPADAVRTRAVRVRPEVVGLMDPLALNIVLQRAELPPERAFDLVIGTNILIYYSTFEQALALANVEAMLAPGGVFLTNDLSLELPEIRVRPSGIVNVNYFPGQADQVRLYTRSTFQLQLPPL
jgi:hypothetical protein